MVFVFHIFLIYCERPSRPDRLNGAYGILGALRLRDWMFFSPILVVYEARYETAPGSDTEKPRPLCLLCGV